MNEHALKAFKKLVTNRFYVTAGIFIFVLQKTHLKNILRVDEIAVVVSQRISIHLDHLIMMYKLIEELYSVCHKEATNNL